MPALTRDQAPRAARGPVQSTERALAPDLARGVMLLLIAVANSAGVFLASTPGLDQTPHGAERYLNTLLSMFVHARALPLFAIMFGYGLVQLSSRQDAAGSTPGAVRGVLLRRHAWLLAFGLVHGVLLYSGDILGAYGLVGIVFTLVLLRRSQRVHQFAAWYVGVAGIYVVVLGTIVAVRLATGATGRAPVPTSAFPSALADSYLASLVTRLGEWPVGTAIFLPIILFVWVGAWAARRRVLEEPANHVRLLRTGAVVGLTVGVVGGLPMGLLAGDFLHVDAGTATLVRMLYETSGLFGGIGYVCLFGLVALAFTRALAAPRQNVVVGSLTALGQRSLSGYLFQSVAWLVLASPFALSLGTRLGSPLFTSVGCAVAVWLVSVAGAYLMQRRSYRGPAEALLRRLTYGTPRGLPRRGRHDPRT